MVQAAYRAVKDRPGEKVADEAQDHARHTHQAGPAQNPADSKHAVVFCDDPAFPKGVGGVDAAHDDQVGDEDQPKQNVHQHHRRAQAGKHRQAQQHGAGNDGAGHFGGQQRDSEMRKMRWLDVRIPVFQKGQRKECGQDVFLL